ncbi:MAG: hypothetical protein V7K68_15100 [Nostoc sp.]|uniref:hypothetical protein n=1 Tax=Nostoc sp. TaxID=1180 RepID=UPI002FFA5788
MHCQIGEIVDFEVDVYNASRLCTIDSDLDSIPLFLYERGFEAYSPTLQGLGLGIRSVLDSTANRYINWD